VDEWRGLRFPHWLYFLRCWCRTRGVGTRELPRAFPTAPRVFGCGSRESLKERGARDRSSVASSPPLLPNHPPRKTSRTSWRCSSVGSTRASKRRTSRFVHNQQPQNPCQLATRHPISNQHTQTNQPTIGSLCGRTRVAWIARLLSSSCTHTRAGQVRSVWQACSLRGARKLWLRDLCREARCRGRDACLAQHRALRC